MFVERKSFHSPGEEKDSYWIRSSIESFQLFLTTHSTRTHTDTDHHHHPKFLSFSANRSWPLPRRQRATQNQPVLRQEKTKLVHRWRRKPPRRRHKKANRQRRPSRSRRAAPMRTRILDEPTPHRSVHTSNRWWPKPLLKSVHPMLTPKLIWKSFHCLFSSIHVKVLLDRKLWTTSRVATASKVAKQRM